MANLATRHLRYRMSRYHVDSPMFTDDVDDNCSLIDIDDNCPLLVTRWSAMWWSQSVLRVSTVGVVVITTVHSTLKALPHDGSWRADVDALRRHYEWKILDPSKVLYFQSQASTTSVKTMWYILVAGSVVTIWRPKCNLKPCLGSTQQLSNQDINIQGFI